MRIWNALVFLHSLNKLSRVSHFIKGFHERTAYQYNLARLKKSVVGQPISHYRVAQKLGAAGPRKSPDKEFSQVDRLTLFVQPPPIV